MKAKGTYAVNTWEENPYEHISSEMKMTKASVEYAMSGEISGRAHVEYLMFHKYCDTNDQQQSSAQYLGLIRFAGNVQGKEGSFVAEDHGSFENGVASSTLQIVTGSGTGALKDIQGTGRYSANHNGAQIELEYDL